MNRTEWPRKLLVIMNPPIAILDLPKLIHLQRSFSLLCKAAYFPRLRASILMSNFLEHHKIHKNDVKVHKRSQTSCRPLEILHKSN